MPRPSRAACTLFVYFACGVITNTALALDTYIEDTDRFPGWKGELPSVAHAEYTDGSVGYGEVGKVNTLLLRKRLSAYLLVFKPRFSCNGTNPSLTKFNQTMQEIWRGKVEQISWEPRAFLFHNFLSEEECDHLIDLAEGRLQKSTVVDSKTGGSVDSDVRTSSGTFLSHQEDEVVTRIEKRLGHVTMIPEENGESLQILKYINGQKYEPHTDYFHDKVNSDPSHGGQRIATVLMYLTTPEEGGETVFPQGAHKVTGPEWSECAKKGLAVKSVRGNALLFYSLHPDGREDPRSLHGSCPTLKGTKYSATKWIHVGPFNAGGRKADPTGCTDANDRCEEWAAWGECEKNPGYMLSACRKACGKCGDAAGKKNDSVGIGQKGLQGKVLTVGNGAAR
jgi:prolyl 4-hydroxylase